MIVGALVTGYNRGISNIIASSATVILLLICTDRCYGAASVRKHSTLFILACALLELSRLLLVVDGC